MNYILKYDPVSVYKRAERLACAVFLVANVMPESESLKLKIKYLAMELVSITAALQPRFISINPESFDQVETVSLQLSSFIDIASVSGLISDMNGAILKKEFESFVATLHQIRNSYENSVRITDDFFGKKNIDLEPLDSPAFTPGKITKNDDQRSLSGTEKDTSNRSQSRERAILDLIRTKGDVSIKDISKSIRGCSEKTIQRSLLSLVNGKVIKKTGERRWSRYSII